MYLNTPGTWNSYAYVSGDPVGSNDPTGLEKAAPDPSYCDLNPYDGACDCNSDPYVCPGGGGGGGSASDDFFGADENDALKDLANPMCYGLYGFTSAAAAQSAFKGLTFKIGNYGKLNLVNGTP